jgi:hypothetical protein
MLHSHRTRPQEKGQVVLNRSAGVPKLAKWILKLRFLSSAAVAILASIRLRI